MPDTALLERVRGLLSGSSSRGGGRREVWARLRTAGVRTSLRQVLRLMREHGLLALRRIGRSRGRRDHDGAIISDSLDTMWGTDRTTTWAAEG